MIIILHNLALFSVKNTNLFAIFFSENIFKIITSVLGRFFPIVFFIAASNRSFGFGERDGPVSAFGQTKHFFSWVLLSSGQSK
jgi:hypothetical protein